MRQVTAAFVIAILLVLSATVARAQVGDSCTGVEHFPAEPVEGAPSALTVAVTVPPELAGGTATISIDGPSGPASATGTVDANGVVSARLPLYDYGTHTITSISIDKDGETTDVDPTAVGDEGTVVVDDAESVCDGSELTTVAPVETTTTSTSTTTVAEVAEAEQSTTTAPVVESVETTAAAQPAVASSTTEPTEQPEPTDEVDDTDEQTESDRNAAWLIPVLGGLALIGTGAVLLAKHDRNCDQELAAWQAAQAECDQASAAAEATQAACDEANEAVDELEQQRRELCAAWPPACWGGGDGNSAQISGDPSSRITQRDLHMKKVALGALWDDYEAGNISAQDVEDAWNEANTPEFREELREPDAEAAAELAEIDGQLEAARDAAATACDAAAEAQSAADEACARAAAAKAAYEACIGAASATPATSAPDPKPEDPGGSEPPGESPPSEPETEPPGEEPPEETLCCPAGFWAGYGWIVGGTFFVIGSESAVVHFFCVNHPEHYVSFTSRTWRFGLGLGGETSFFAALMWDVQHATDVPRVWREKGAEGFDMDFTFGVGITKGAKTLAKAGAIKELVRFLHFQAKQKVDYSELDPRQVRNVMKAFGGVAQGTGRGFLGQGLDPQVLIVPWGYGLQIGAWMKAGAATGTLDFKSCGCPWPY